jgi:hypothetical protein
LTDTLSPAGLSQKKTQKDSSVPVTFGKFAPKKRNPDMLSSSKDDNADADRIAIIEPSRETREYSQVLI